MHYRSTNEIQLAELAKLGRFTTYMQKRKLMLELLPLGGGLVTIAGVLGCSLRTARRWHHKIVAGDLYGAICRHTWRYRQYPAAWRYLRFHPHLKRVTTAMLLKELTDRGIPCPCERTLGRWRREIRYIKWHSNRTK